MKVRLSLNDIVKIKLRPRGFVILRENHQRAGDQRTYLPPHVDNDGWSSLPLWKVMADFGPHIAAGAHDIFETTDIEIG